VKAYQQITNEEFKGLRFTDILNNAALDDAEFSILDNFNLTDMGTLTKRNGWASVNANVTATLKNPTTVPALLNPITIRFPGPSIQRRAPTGANPNKIWFSDVGQTNLWCADLPSFTNVTLCQSNIPGAITGVEWMIEASMASAPYSMQGCRTNGNPFGCVESGGQFVGISASGPLGTHLTLFKDRLWMVNSVSTINFESRLFYTDIASFGTWGASNFIDINPNNGEFLVATIVFNDQLIIFKNNSTWVLTADGLPTNWVLRNLHPTIGCSGRGTPIIINGFIYFLSTTGLYRTDGTTFERISAPVDSFLSNFSTSTGGTVLNRNAYYYDEKYILVTPDQTTGVNTTFLVYDLRREAWSRWVTGGATQLDFQGLVFYGDTIPPRLYGGIRTPAGTGKVWQLSTTTGYQDDGSNFTCTARTKRFTWGDPTVYKRNFMFMLDVGYTQTEPQNLTVVHSVDNLAVGQPHSATNVNTTAVSTYDFSRKELKFAGAGYHRAMHTVVTYIGDKNMDIFKMSWLNQVKDQATVKTSN
jgi:hypothetical protein